MIDNIRISLQSYHNIYAILQHNYRKTVKIASFSAHRLHHSPNSETNQYPNARAERVSGKNGKCCTFAKQRKDFTESNSGKTFLDFKKYKQSSAIRLWKA